MPNTQKPLHISVITLFPDIFESHLKHLPISRAIEKGLMQVNFINLRDFAIDKRGTVDSPPYGGGPGMILRPEPVFGAINYALACCNEKSERIPQRFEERAVRSGTRNENAVESVRTEIIFLTPRGKTYHQVTALQLSTAKNLILICGRYEGIDQRVVEYFTNPISQVANIHAQEISIGNYVLSGGEVAAMAIIESIARLIPGVIENKEALVNESFNPGCPNQTEHPQYSRPKEWKGLKVPQTLLSGHHGKIKKWKDSH